MISTQCANNYTNPTTIDNYHHGGHYRQLSLRNTNQHHRQVSSPATSQQYYTQQRPVSSYYEYEKSSFKNSDQQQQQKLENQHFRKGPLLQNQSQQRQHLSNYNNQMQSNYSTKKETLYGIVGHQQQAVPTKRPIVPGLNIIRNQQPIYQSNQVQIYGSIYGSEQTTSPNNYVQQQQQQQQQQQRSLQQTSHTINSRTGLYGSFPRNNNETIYGHSNGLPPNTYLTK